MKIKQDLELLKSIEEFLNKVPNREYGNNYKMVEKLPAIVERYQKMYDLLLLLKKDAQMALDDKWDKGNGGFEAQIYLIDNLIG
jgi:hypothetical protein